MNRFALAVAIFFAATGLARADGFPSDADARDALQRAMNVIASGKVERGMESLRPHTTFNADQFASLTDQFLIIQKSASRELGKSLEAEFMCLERTGASVMRLHYLQKFEEAGIPWTFTLYRVSRDWMIIGMQQHGTLDGFYCFDESEPEGRGTGMQPIQDL